MTIEWCFSAVKVKDILNFCFRLLDHPVSSLDLTIPDLDRDVLSVALIKTTDNINHGKSSKATFPIWTDAICPSTQFCFTSLSDQTDHLARDERPVDF